MKSINNELNLLGDVVLTGCMMTHIHAQYKTVLKFIINYVSVVTGK